MSAMNVHWTVKQRPSALFTGRDEIVQTIIDAIDPRLNDSKTLDKMFVITGMGGQGKSEVCLNVASKLRNQYVSAPESLAFLPNNLALDSGACFGWM